MRQTRIRFFQKPVYTSSRFSLLLCPSFYSYLALAAALSSEADFVFIPENPVKENWGEKMCQKLAQVQYGF